MDERQKQPIIGEAPAFLEMLEHVSRAAPLAKPVLVVGERGTGKELVASRLHFLSERWEQPLVKVNCAALTESILESELFGHEAGAFTGAVRKHVGHFERADGGTLVLDELATVPMRTQEKILRVIEYGEFERVGGSETLQVDVRIVGSTNEDLQARVGDGRFRADLLDRLAFDVITVPPLRERPDDILPLAYTFAVNMTAELRRAYFPGFTARTASTLLRHHWPGNVRELKNAVERGAILADEAIEPDMLPGEQDAAPPDARTLSLPVGASIADAERRLILATLEAFDGNKKRAAETLGISLKTLYNRLNVYEAAES